ncbi:protein RKD4 [Carica papaya]|uniref:protein RKD4 n=1 Tax=Carica papaya TaxID=3649 RepID=UPI000B8CBFD2|nr:protein RKD4 [Carica papaya]
MENSAVNGDLVPKMEGDPLYQFDWVFFEESFEKIMELPPLPSLLELTSTDSYTEPLRKQESTELTEIKGFDDEVNLYEDFTAGVKPLNVAGGSSSTELTESDTRSLVHDRVRRGSSEDQKEDGEERRMKRRRKKSSELELKEIQKHFDSPITMAAKEMKVGLTVLKKRCRELNITRWPHRKIKSLKSLIENVRELGMDGEIAVLKEHKRLLEAVPDMELSQRTKKLRQVCFKANYKRRRALAKAAA